MSGVSADLRLNRPTVSEVYPASLARNSQFIMRLPKGSAARALPPPADWALPNPPEPALREEPEPESAASMTLILRSPHRKLKRPLESAYATVCEMPPQTRWMVMFCITGEPSSMTTLPEM